MSVGPVKNGGIFNIVPLKMNKLTGISDQKSSCISNSMKIQETAFDFDILIDIPRVE